MSELQQACFAVDGGYRLTASEMRDEFDAYGDHSETDSIGGFDSASHLVAAGWCQIPESAETERRSFVWLFVHDVGWVSWTPCSSGSGGERGMILAIWATAWRLLYRYEVYDTMTADSAFMDRHGFVRARYFTENACLGVDTESPTRGQPGLRAPRLRPRATLDGLQEATVQLRMVTAAVGSASGVSAFVTICPSPRGEIPMPATTPR
ncbi:MAG: hypothetical protein IIC70_07040 [Acidobacteria bacterium]|nr:hypothetical protein [Acidobacteriota bacterium]